MSPLSRKTLTILIFALFALKAEAASHKWVAFFAKGTGYTEQAYDSVGDWRSLMAAVRKRKNQGFEIST